MAVYHETLVGISVHWKMSRFVFSFMPVVHVWVTTSYGRGVPFLGFEVIDFNVSLILH